MLDDLFSLPVVAQVSRNRARASARLRSAERPYNCAIRLFSNLLDYRWPPRTGHTRKLVVKAPFSRWPWSMSPK